MRIDSRGKILELEQQRVGDKLNTIAPIPSITNPYPFLLPQSRVQLIRMIMQSTGV